MSTMYAVLLGVIISAIVTFVVCYFLPKEKVREQNKQLEQQEQEISKHIQDLNKEYSHKVELLESDYRGKTLELISTFETKQNELALAYQNEKNSKEQGLLKEKQQLELELTSLEEKKKSTLALIEDLKRQAQEAANTFKEQALEIATQDVEKATNSMRETYEHNKTNFENEYNNIVADTIQRFQNETQRLDGIIEEKKQKLVELQSKVDAATEVNKRAELERNEKDFYRLQLSEQDIEEIEKIRSIIPYLRSAEPINKVIWTVYYQKPYTDLIGRVVGSGRKTGIYKITNIENQMCYVGQAVDIADRWKQHIRRGVGADPPTRNKLYPAMLAIGVENFTFEIIEECAGKDLNSREDYWQNFYHAKDFGYSIK